ncbi:kinase-like domain-containing protein [Triangularia verruculosa]|uniref:Kinase-like domain-containing protein n=1 Tax=Triangularia verruculosa TaxID=2587418 RepID=A0AAN6XKL3_9PEZI|nr:kinase-like domain-containing protein [Triangularia verruculosa]
MVFYGHVFKDTTGQYLFICPLGTGATCRADLVRHIGTGEYRVRKVLHRRVTTGKELPRSTRYTLDPEIKAIIQFNNEVAIVDLLQKSAEGKQVKIPTLVSHSTHVDERKGKYSRVSYWSLSNGGDLDSFILDYDWIIPRPFILQFLSQILTTLHHLYTAHHDSLGPIIHNDCHAGNILLHYPNGQTRVPEFHLIDFGLATPLSRAPIAEKNDFLLPTPGKPVDWDIPGVLNTLDKLLATWPPQYQSFLRSRGDPVGVAYHLLSDLDRRFQNLVLRHSKYTNAARDLPQHLTLPDLRPVIDFVNSSPVTSDFEGVEMKGFTLHSETYRDMCDPVSSIPRAYYTVDEIQHTTDLPGPWHIGRLDKRGRVLDLLAVQKKDTFHRPNEGNDNSDTDSAWGEG